MRHAISKILEKYFQARKETPFKGPHEISELFNRLRMEVSELPSVKRNSNLIVKSSYGKGNWATVPWLAILDTRETSSTQDGTYVVFLFQEEGKGCHLKLAQGVTEISNRLKSKAGEELKKRADAIRNTYRTPALTRFEPTQSVYLESSGRLGNLYESSTIFSRYYERNSIPEDDVLAADVSDLLAVYENILQNSLRRDVQEDDPDDSPNAYSAVNIIDEGSFLGLPDLEAILDRLRIKKNIVLQGPPGTGKTWLARRLGYALVGQKNAARVRVTQFHANLAYEDFVRGYRPTGEGKLALVDGAFMQAIEDARNSTQPLVFVIEEINRGNPAQIFGEMLTLLEADKRGVDQAMELTYRRADGERVFVPPNLYVIGTMNVADRSLALVDLALRRRFAFIDMEPSFNSSWRNWLVSNCSFPAALVSLIESKLLKLNEDIAKDSRLGPQFKVGHSFVTPSPDVEYKDHREWFRQVVRTEISPLLAEYWFDDPETASKHVAELLRDF